MVLHASDKGYWGRLAEIAGILATTTIRHELTDYDTLIRVHKLTRKEARLVVAGELRDILQSWKKGSAQNDPGVAKVRRRFRRLRKTVQRKRDACHSGDISKEAALIAQENAAVTLHVLAWLEKRGMGTPELVDSLTANRLTVANKS